MFKNFEEYENSAQMALKRILNRTRYNWNISENNEGQKVVKNNTDTKKFINGILHNPEYTEYLLKNGYSILTQSITNKELYNAIIIKYPKETLKEININNVDIVEVRRCILKICNEEMRDQFMNLQFALAQKNNKNNNPSTSNIHNTEENNIEEQRRERRRQLHKQIKQDQKVLKKVLNNKEYDWNLTENIQGQKVVKDNEDTKKFIDGLVNDSRRYTNRLIRKGFVILAQSMTYKDLYHSLKSRYNQKILKEINIDNVDFVEVRKCILNICNERMEHRQLHRQQPERPYTIKEFALKNMARQRLPKEYEKDTIMQINMALRIILNGKNWNWNHYRNIDNKPLKKEFGKNTGEYIHLIDRPIGHKYGYICLAESNTYRELHANIKRRLKLTEDELKNINLEKVNFKEVCRALLKLTNDEMRYALYWSQMGNP